MSIQFYKDRLMSYYKKGFIRESISPCVVPALLVSKKDESWRIYVDSRRINQITVKYQFPISMFRDLLDELYGAWVFSKIDLCRGIIRFGLGLEMSGRQRSRQMKGCISGL